MTKKQVLDLVSLDEQIKYFNDWNSSANLLLDLRDNSFETQVFRNDPAIGSNVLTEDYVVIISKNERSNKQIGKVRRENIIKFCEMVLDGESPDVASYHIHI